MLTFEEALTRAGEVHRKRHLLLGNGFSIAARPESFRYGRLLEEADLAALTVPGGDLFASEKTSDFEAVIRALRTTSRMVGFYKTRDRGLAKRLADDAERLKEILAATLASKHPDYVGAIDREEYQAARHFLGHFERFFTLNYDLLLYWALLQALSPSYSMTMAFALIRTIRTLRGLPGTITTNIDKTFTSSMAVFIYMRMGRRCES